MELDDQFADDLRYYLNRVVEAAMREHNERAKYDTP